MNAQNETALRSAIENLLPLLTADFNALEPWQAEIDALLKALNPNIEPFTPSRETVEVHLARLSFEDAGGGLSFEDTETLLREADKNPTFAQWLYGENDLELLFIWLEWQAVADETGELTPVDFVASGYEWICPVCAELNHEIEILETVTCRTCTLSCNPDPAEHAYF